MGKIKYIGDEDRTLPNEGHRLVVPGQVIEVDDDARHGRANDELLALLLDRGHALVRLRQLALLALDVQRGHADRAGDHLVIPLPYGTQVDWVRNVLTAGGATVVRKGETLVTEAPEIIDATQALPMVTRDHRRSFERVGIRHFLQLRIT